MFRKMTISLIVAMVAILALAVAVSAQGRGPGAGFNRDGAYAGTMGVRGQQMNDEAGTQGLMQQRFLHQKSDGTCANFVDEDGDGVCDNAGQQLDRVQMNGRQAGMAGRGMRGATTGQSGARSGDTMMQQFGDGVCDQETPPRDGTGSQYGRQE